MNFQKEKAFVIKEPRCHKKMDGVDSIKIKIIHEK